MISLSIGNLYGQRVADSVALDSPVIKVLARAQKDRVLLRWGVSTPLAWKQLNSAGYTIERFTVTRNGKTLSTPEKKVLTTTPLKPEPLDNWMQIIETNDNAAIVAQALYGESFEVTGLSSLEAIVSMSEDLQQRFTFTLFTADQDFKVAQMAALGYIDNDVKPNEKYAYRVISNVEKTLNNIDFGGVFIGLQDFNPLPLPLDIAAVFNDGSALLSWNFKLMNTIYNSYNVERSSDGFTFNKINKSPYTILNEANQDKRTGRIFYVDSITNSRKYTYRVQGITPFGELGPYSETVSGKGKELLEFVPHLTTKELKDENNVKLTWEFPQEGNDKIRGFELNRSNGKGETLEVVVNNIPPISRTVTYNKLNPSNYFTITAVSKNGNKRNSFPMLVQPVDSIPPTKPIGLKGEVDSLGIVKLSWTKNAETDLLGYRVFRGNREKEEFSQLTINPQKPNTFIDTVKVKNLNDKVYYKIFATDLRYNLSEPSEVLVIKKPDFIPPTSPVFKNYELRDDKINLMWAQSSSTDVAKQMIYRKTNDAPDWVLIFETEEQLESFTDGDIVQGNMYSYTILAMDDSGLESDPSPSISIAVPKTKTETEIKGFYAQADKTQTNILLSWRYKAVDLIEFEIYKSKKGEKLRLLRVVPADTRRLYDNDLSINTEYQYAIRAVFKDGRMSKLATKDIKY